MRVQTGANNIVDTGGQVWMNQLMDLLQSFRRVTAFLAYADEWFVVLAGLCLNL
jgi:hypothetical protein